MTSEQRNYRSKTSFTKSLGKEDNHPLTRFTTGCRYTETSHSKGKSGRRDNGLAFIHNKKSVRKSTGNRRKGKSIPVTICFLDVSTPSPFRPPLFFKFYRSSSSVGVKRIVCSEERFKFGRGKRRRRLVHKDHSTSIYPKSKSRSSLGNRKEVNARNSEVAYHGRVKVKAGKEAVGSVRDCIASHDQLLLKIDDQDQSLTELVQGINNDLAGCPTSHDHRLFSDLVGGEDQSRGLKELVESLNEFIIRDDESLCGFSVIYFPARATTMEEGLPTTQGGDQSQKPTTTTTAFVTTSSSTGVQAGEGTVKDPIYAVAAEFAEKHGYGFVEFVDDVHGPRSAFRSRKRRGNRIGFSRVMSNRDERRSVVRKEVGSPARLCGSQPPRGMNARCGAGVNLQRFSVLNHMQKKAPFEANLNSVEKIAGQISKIDLADYDGIIPVEHRAMFMQKARDKEEEQALINEKLQAIEAQVEEEIIRSAPLGQYMSYLSNVCKSIYQDTTGETPDSQDTMNSVLSLSASESKAEAGDRPMANEDLGGSAIDKAALIASKIKTECLDKVNAEGVTACQREVIRNEAKKPIRRRNNNNNIPKQSEKRSSTESPSTKPSRVGQEKEKANASGSGRIPRVSSKSTKQYRFSNSLSSCIAREVELMKSRPTGLCGVRSELLRGKMEVVRYGCSPSDIDEEEPIESATQVDRKAPPVAVAKHVRGQHGQSGGVKAAWPATSSPSRQSSTSSSSSSASRAARQAGQTCDDARKIHQGVPTKPHKHELWASSCPDLSSTASAELQKDAGPLRKKEGVSPQRSPTKDAISRRTTEEDAERASPNSTACAQGDMKSPTSWFVGVRPQGKGDVDASSHK